MQVVQTYRKGECGNGICEVGERQVMSNGTQTGLVGSCPEDCPVQYSACPVNDGIACSGNGQCMSNQGMCDCSPG